MTSVHFVVISKRGEKMRVEKQHLLLLAGIVWCAAGFNVLRIGVDCYWAAPPVLGGMS